MHRAGSAALFVAAWFFGPWAHHAHAAGCAVESGTVRLPVLELYTSEGCSSCPPADRWLSREFGAAGKAPAALPLAYHVDYWNSLGWPDRFASPEHSVRQHRVAERQRSSVVYTPQFVLDGRSVRPAEFDREIASRTRQTASDKPRAWIRVADVRIEGAGVRVTGEVRADRTGARSEAAVRVVLFQNGLGSDVKAGENGGRRLMHDFVVRGVAGPFTPGPDGRVALDVRLPIPAEFVAARAGIAVHVEDTADGTTWQAVAAPVCTAPG